MCVIGSIYRGSPERSLPRSPDYTNNSHVQNRPTTSRVGSSKPSVASENSTSEKYYDTHKFKPNYYMSKRSLTSCDESGFERNKSTTNVLKSRQLQMGKAKIDLGTQQSKVEFNYFLIYNINLFYSFLLDLNVGVTVKNIGAYLKIPSRNTPENLKPSNSKTNINNNSTNSNNTNSESIKYGKQSNGANQNSTQRQSSIHSNTNTRMQGSDSVNSLPRIRLSS